MSHFQTVRLPGTKTKPFRSASFLRVSLAEGRLTGILTVDEKTTEVSRLSTQRYALQLRRTEKDGSRTFRLTKPGGVEWYYVCLAAGHDVYDTCECIAFEKMGGCRHLASLRALDREGHLAPGS